MQDVFLKLRMARDFTQRQAAEAVDISKLQWLRYEHGAKVPREKLGKIAEALDISPRRIFYLAGYKTSPTRNDANVLLRQMHNKMLAGDLVGAWNSSSYSKDLFEQLRPGLMSILMV